MFTSFIVIYALIAVASATAPILVSECGTLETSFTTYQLVNDIAISDHRDGFVCFDIKGNGITLEGNGFQLSSASNELLHATGVQYSGLNSIVKNLRIANLRTGIHANGKFGKVEHNTITQAINGIDVSATYNEISNNVIGNFNANESTSGIYVYFPARVPIASFINITNNVISDIRGDSFVIGISVYHATSVYVANNRIFNLVGIATEEISVIQGKADIRSNVFSPPAMEASLPSTTLLLSCVAVLASALWFFRNPTTSTAASTPFTTSFPTPIALTSSRKGEKEEDEEEERKWAKEVEKKKEAERNEFGMDGAEVVKSTLSFSVGSSPSTKSLSL